MVEIGRNVISVCMPAYLPPTYLPTSIYLSIHACLPTYLSLYLLTASIPTYLVPTCLPVCMRACTHACTYTYIDTHSHTHKCMRMCVHMYSIKWLPSGLCNHTSPHLVFSTPCVPRTSCSPTLCSPTLCVPRTLCSPHLVFPTSCVPSTLCSPTATINYSANICPSQDIHFLLSSPTIFFHKSQIVTTVFRLSVLIKCTPNKLTPSRAYDKFSLSLSFIWNI